MKAAESFRRSAMATALTTDLMLSRARMLLMGLAPLVALALGISAASPVSAQYTLNTLALFNGTDGAIPASNLILSGGILYSATENGSGGHGEVFSLPVAGGTPTVLASLNGTNGPTGIILSGSTLYGTTWGRAANGYGQVFSLPVTGGTPTILASFNSTIAVDPNSLIISGSTLYGTTFYGGANGDGEVFSVPIAGGTPTVLASLNGTNGSNPTGGLVLSGGRFYGTASNGGLYGDGTVFSLPVSGGAPTVLATFSGPNGVSPNGVILSGGTLYGTTSNGGSTYTNSFPVGDGEVFSLPVAGGIPTVLESFPVINQIPVGGLLLSGNILYGTTSGGGDAGGGGEVFSEPISGGIPTMLASFDFTDGADPITGLIMDSSGNLYGTTALGGLSNPALGGDGTVFEVAVPEPSSIGLLLIGSAALLRHIRFEAKGARRLSCRSAAIVSKLKK